MKIQLFLREFGNSTEGAKEAGAPVMGKGRSHFPIKVIRYSHFKVFSAVLLMYKRKKLMSEQKKQN
jgi:hypothetical protein